jgi:hypothetical protein
MISQRTKAAFAAAKASGQQLGDPGIGKLLAAPDAYAESLRAIVTPMVGMTTRALAGELNYRSIKTRAAASGDRRR